MSENTNPLAKFFRQPAIYLRLPSNGHGYPAGDIEMPANGELPVYPMTAIDEITYRTPDALFNGEAVIQVVQSCVPNIKNAWSVPSTDLDALLIAIRIASFGHNVELDTTCPSCEHEQAFNLDLRNILDKLQSPNFEQPLIIGDLTFFFRPLDYKEMTANSLLQFEQQKTMQVLSDSEVSDEDKMKNLQGMMKKLTETTVRTMAQGILEIRADGNTTTDVNHIEEFLNNCDRGLFARIKDHIVALREQSEMKPLDLTCVECQHKYQQIFTLDNARFFGEAS
jgi:hypothetical protein